MLSFLPLTSLRQGITKYGLAPHKPILLLGKHSVNPVLFS